MPEFFIPLKWLVLNLAIVEVMFLGKSKSVVKGFLLGNFKSLLLATALASASVMVEELGLSFWPSLASRSAHSLPSMLTCGGIHWNVHVFPLRLSWKRRSLMWWVMLDFPFLIASRADSESEKMTRLFVEKHWWLERRGELLWLQIIH